MGEPFYGEIRIFPYTYAPRGWALCDGSRMSIPQHSTLFAVIGGTFGGDYQTYFNLPNLTGRVPMHYFNNHVIGEAGGAAQVALSQAQLPGHAHTLTATSETADQKLCDTDYMLGKVKGRGTFAYSDSTADLVNLSSQSTVTPAGNTQPHENRQPSLSLNFCIALEGVYPSRS